MYDTEEINDLRSLRDHGRYNDMEEQIAVQTEVKEGIIMPYDKKEEVYVEDLGEIPKKPIYSFFKRTFDIIFSLLALILLFIPMCIIAIAIKVSTKSSIFYLQERLGKNGKPFKVIKFKSMVDNAESNGAQWTTGDDDPRTTKIGRVLRKYYLDELPQLICILTGKMSFVGPRPERECFYKEFETYIHGFSQRLKVKPGLTGMAQIKGDDALRPEIKIQYDIEYIKKRSLLVDLKAIFGTIAVIFD